MKGVNMRSKTLTMPALLGNGLVQQCMIMVF